MTKPFNPALPCTTRDGRPVRILCTDAKGEQPIIGLITTQDCDVIEKWGGDGTFMFHGCQSNYDLINVPTKRKGWIGVEPALRGERIALTSNVCPSEAQVRESTCNSFAQYIEIDFDE